MSILPRLLCALVVLLSACSTGPEPVTLERAERIVNEHQLVYGEALSRVLADPVIVDDDAPPPELVDRLREVFAGQLLGRKVDELGTFASTPGPRSVVLPPEQVTGLRYELNVVVETQPGCLVVVGRAHREGVLPDGGPGPALSALSLAPAPADVDTGTNPTGWVTIDVMPNVSSTGQVLPDDQMLDAELEDLVELDTTCADAAV